MVGAGGGRRPPVTLLLNKGCGYEELWPEAPAAGKRGVGSTPHRWLATRRGQVPAPQHRPVGSTRLPTGYDSDNLPAGAIGNDFRESQHPALAAPFRAARSPFHRTPDGMD